MRVKIADSPSPKKKCVVALARQLAVDLWSWRTGRSSLEDLGWNPGLTRPPPWGTDARHTFRRQRTGFGTQGRLCDWVPGKL